MFGFIRDVKVQIDAPLKTEDHKIKYNVNWNHESPLTKQSFNLQCFWIIVSSILMGITLKQNDKVDLKLDFGKMNIENVGVLRPRFTYSFDKFVEARDLQMKLGLKRENTSVSLKLNDRLKEGMHLNTKVKRLLNPFSLQWTTETKLKEYFRHGIEVAYRKKECPLSFSLRQEFMDYYMPYRMDGRMKYNWKEKMVLKGKCSVGDEKRVSVELNEKVNEWLSLKQSVGNLAIGGGFKAKVNDSVQVKVSSVFKLNKYKRHIKGLPFKVDIKLKM